MKEINFRGRKVLITGGLGMIGSSIAIRLRQLGADITILDAELPMYGANTFNLEPIRGQVKMVKADIRDRRSLEQLKWDFDMIFNLAGQVSHNDSIENPYLDTEINYLGQLNVLEQARKKNPKARIFFSGSRLQFGKIEAVPVAENHPQHPLTPYALNKNAAENLHLFYHHIHGISVVVFRIANPYGPRGQMKHSKYCIVNWFVRQAMEGKTITVFGDGKQLRDYIFIDDLVEAMLAAMSSPQAGGEVFNVGSGVGISFQDMTALVVRTVGRGSIRHVGWPADYINVETGDYVSNIQKLCRLTSWRPRISIEEGIRRTVAYFRRHGCHYF